MNDYKQKPPFYMSVEKFQNFEYSEEATYLSDIVKQINEIKGKDKYKQLDNRHIIDKLVGLGILIYDDSINGNYAPTELGIKLGISIQDKMTDHPYKVCQYNLQAQKFLVHYLASECKYKFIEKDSWDISNKGKLWSDADTDKLEEMFYQGTTERAMAIELKRTISGVCHQLHFLEFSTLEI